MNDLAGERPAGRRGGAEVATAGWPDEERAANAPLRARLRAVLVCTLLTGLSAAAGLAIERATDFANTLLVFLPVVLFAAVRYGFWAAAGCSALAVVLLRYLAAPANALAASDPANAWALLMFTVVAAFTSSLAARLRQRAAALAEHGAAIEQLYAFSSALAGLSSAEELADEAARQAAFMVGARVTVLLPSGDGLRVRAASSPGPDLEAREMLAASWCFRHGQPAGRGTGVFHGVRQLYLPLETARGTVGVLAIFRDGPGPILSGEQSRLVDALGGQLAVSLERARLAEEMHENEMLAQTEKLRSALLTSISHDLKTPLASILGNVSSLRQYGHLYDDATRAEMLANAEEETLRLSRFVDNLLDMTRIDAGALRPTFENVDLTDLVGSALQRVEKLTQHHAVRTELPPDLPMVPLNFVMAEHVLVNLLENAAKYSPPGSTITIAVEESAEHVTLSVSDEGPGIPAGDLPHVFERFFRAAVADRRRAGVGLGLAIGKGFVEAMGGTIMAANRTDRSGALFAVTLPKQRPKETER